MNASHSYRRVLYVGILSGLILSLNAIFSGQIRAAPPAKSLGGAANLPAVVLPQISSVTLNPSSVTGGTQVVGTVTLKQPAPAGGVAVIFRSSNPAVGAVAPGVTVQPGATSGTFIVQTQPVVTNPNVVTGPPSVQISAQIGNAAPVIAQLTVLPPTMVSLTLNPTSVPSGTGSTGTVTFIGPAPSGGIVVTLSANAATSAPTPPPRALAARSLSQPPVSLPQQITIPAGATTASFQITTRGVSAPTVVQIAASRGVFVTKTATLTLLPPGIGLVTLSPTKDPVGGASLVGTVTMEAPASAEGTTVTLSLSDTHTYPTCGPAPVVPANIQVVAGSTSATFPVTTSPGTGRYRLSASLSGSSKFVDIFVREALINSDSLVFTQSVKGGTIVQASLQLIGVASTCGRGGKYKLQSSDTNLAQVPPEVTVALGSSVGTFPITTSAVPSPRTVDISVLGNVGYGLVWLKKTLTLTPN